jgi:hypothetical protein
MQYENTEWEVTRKYKVKIGRITWTGEEQHYYKVDEVKLECREREADGTLETQDWRDVLFDEEFSTAVLDHATIKADVGDLQGTIYFGFDSDNKVCTWDEDDCTYEPTTNGNEWGIVGTVYGTVTHDTSEGWVEKVEEWD